MQFLLLAALAVTLITGSAKATTPPSYDPKATLLSGKVLQGALSDIARMQEVELRAFTRYLSECGQSGGHACDAAYASYRIEFWATRPLDDLMAARSWRETTAHVEVEKGRIDFDMLARDGWIVSKLEDSARARFRALRAGEK
jgi:hypothetical protein